MPSVVRFRFLKTQRKLPSRRMSRSESVFVSIRSFGDSPIGVETTFLSPFSEHGFRFCSITATRSYWYQTRSFDEHHDSYGAL